MNKYILLLTSVLTFSAAQAQQVASTKPSTSVPYYTVDSQLANTPITIETGAYRGPLSSLLSAIAKSAGYGLVIEGNVDNIIAQQQSAIINENITAPPMSESNTETGTQRAVIYSFTNQPFSQVWPFLMEVNGLSYEVVTIGQQPVLRVSTDPIQRVVKLHYVGAEEAANQAKLFFGEPVYQTETSVKKDPLGNEEKVTTKILQDVKLDSKTMRIIPDTRTNSVIIRGINKEIAAVVKLLNQIDAGYKLENETDDKKAIESIYTIKGSKEEVIKLLGAQYPEVKVLPTADTKQVILMGEKRYINAATALLNKSDKQLPTIPTKMGERIYAIQGDEEGVLGLLKTRFAGLQVIPVGKTRQLMISGEESAVERAIKLLEQVDRKAGSVPTVQRSFQLVNASAEELKATLEGTLSRNLTAENNNNNNTNNTNNGTANSKNNANNGTTTANNSNNGGNNTNTNATNGIETTNENSNTPQVTIIADKRTNTLIVRGTQSQVDQIAELIPSLDRVVPQINLQVRIQELSDTATRQLGVNSRLNFGSFSIATSSSNGLVGSFNPLSSLVGFNIFPTLNTLETQDLAKRVYEGSVTMQSGQRALSASSNIPAAVLKSGGQLEISIPGNPVISKTIDYGINLNFYDPQVSPDGNITVRILGKINNLDTNLSPNNIPYVIKSNNSEAQSVVTFKNGETLLLSGLMSNKVTNNSSGLPFLARLGIGGNKSTTEEFSQLLIVVTGNIVK